ncbi:GntR family transcriptional regulator [uncultured Meiothermus sp.]|jgi:DNA-binding GntR family transcriptional regulator|uniref:GntR family transcriptional regulator n=1 Tax=uncultured Meiothermus sp. TaxID=157471 RepID=UPI0026052DC6|nr:GntR family transcriptional regulator [uncultured Meiothermus sp.]
MPLPETVRTVKRELAREQVYQQLRDWIIDGTLRPGEPIRDLEMAEALEVSRTPVREALRRLEDEGLVETASHKWTRVALLKAEQADELYGIVQRLEAYALELAQPRLGEAELGELEAANAELRAAIARHDAKAALEADNRFHQVWIERSGNRELAGVLADLKTKLRRLELAHFDSKDAVESVKEHALIIRSLRSGRAETALEAVEGNWEGATDRFRGRLARRKSPA